MARRNTYQLFGRRRDRPTYLSFNPEVRANALLTRHLTPEQLSTWKGKSYIDVRTSYGIVIRLERETMAVVIRNPLLGRFRHPLLWRGNMLCSSTQLPVPKADIILGQKLILESRGGLRFFLKHARLWFR